VDKGVERPVRKHHERPNTRTRGFGPVLFKPVGTLPTIKYRESVANEGRNGCHGQ
jgi:hypothetical protein